MSTDLEIKIKTLADTYGADAVTASLGKLTDSTRKVAAGAGEATQSVRQTGLEMKHLAGLGHEAEGVMIGLERGGLSGVAIAGRNLAMIFRTLATGTLGLVLLPAIVAVGAAMAVMSKISNDNAAQMKKWWGEASDRAELHKRKMAEVAKIAEETMARESEAIRKLTESYAGLEREQNRVQESSRRLMQAKQEGRAADLELAKAKELSGVTDPSQRAVIEAKYDAQKLALGTSGEEAALVTQGLQADVRIKNAEEAKQGINAKIFDARENVSEAKSDFAAKRAAYNGTEDKASPEAYNLLEDALAARSMIEKMEKNLDDRMKEATQIVDAANEQIQTSKVDKEEAGIKLGTLKAKAKAEVIGKTAEIAHSVDLKSFNQRDAAAGDQIDTLRAQVKASEDSALSSHEFGAAADPRLVAKLAEAEASRDAMRSAIADAVNTEKRKNEAFRKNLANTTGP